MLGKFLGAGLFLATMLLLTLPYPLTLYLWASPDPASILGGFVGLALLASALLAMGLLFSALTDNQLVALFLTFTAGLALMLADGRGGDPDALGAHLSLSTHLQGVLKGAVRIADIVYFVVFTGVLPVSPPTSASRASDGAEGRGEGGPSGRCPRIVARDRGRRAVAPHQHPRRGASWLGGIGGALLIAYALLDRERLADAASTRAFVHSLQAAFSVVLAGAFAVALYSLATTQDRTLDLTRDRAFTLSEQARSVVADLAMDVELTAFFRHGSPGQQQFRELAQLFEEASDRVSVVYVDPVENPSAARAAGITGEHGTVLVRAREGAADDPSNERARQSQWQDSRSAACWARLGGPTAPSRGGGQPLDPQA